PWPLVLAVLVSVAIHALGAALPALRPVFHSAAIAPWQWGLVLVLSALVVPAVELGKVAWSFALPSPRTKVP
ncbi:MAG: hypothetical protein EPO40_29040, partial [Myxococcaceae bacterium]